MHEYLELDVGIGSDAIGEFEEARFAGEDDAGRSSLAGEGNGGIGLDGCLRRGMEWNFGEVAPGKPREPPVLENQGVRGKSRKKCEAFSSRRQLGVGDDRVHRHVDPFSPITGEPENTPILEVVEVPRLFSCREIPESEIDGIPSPIEGRDGGIEAAGRKEEFWKPSV